MLNIKNKEAKNKKFSASKKLLGLLVWIVVFCLAFLLGINTYVCASAKSDMYDLSKIEISNADCIMVLGCGVKGGEPSPMLKDRLDTAIELYKKGLAPKLLMSGDHGGQFYNEVGVMKLYAMKNGVPSKDIFMDHAGFSTYESLYRAKEVFDCEKIIAVTQRYHLYRTVFLGESLEIDINGVSTTHYNYGGMFNREIREILARNKDLFTSVIKPRPKMPLGDKISIMGDGDVTNDEAFLKMAESD